MNQTSPLFSGQALSRLRRVSGARGALLTLCAALALGAGACSDTESDADDGGVGGPAAESEATTSASWERIGPWNFYDEASGNGPSGTCAEAVADPTAQSVLYMGGSNNGSASGILKSTDGGLRWVSANTGLTDFRIRALRLDPTAHLTLYAGTPSGIYKSTDGAQTWALEAKTLSFGDVRALVVSTVQGVPWLFAATSSGIAHRPLAGGAWTLSAPPAGAPTASVYILSAASTKPSAPALFYAVLDGGQVYKVTFTTTGVTWAKTAMKVNTLSVDPSNPNHLLGSTPGTGTPDDYTILESTDGGATSHHFNDWGAWYVSFDPRDPKGQTVWSGGETGVGHSTDGGKTWSMVHWYVRSRDGYTADSTQIDVQRLLMDFPGAPAFCSDQGLVHYDPAANVLRSLNGDAKNSVVVSVSVANPESKYPHVLTTMWDWGPTASWNGGRSWQATTWYGSHYWGGPNGQGAPITGEGGQVFAIPHSVDGKSHVIMHDGDHYVFLSSNGGRSFAPLDLAAATSSKSLTVQYDALDWARDASGKATGTVYLLTSVAGKSAIQKSTDFGETWAAWGPSTWPAEPVSTFVVDPKDAAHVLVGAGDCLVSTSDGGKTWSSCEKPSPQGSALRQLALRPDDPTKVLALTDAGELLRSTNAGKTWALAPDAKVAGIVAQADGGSRHLAYAPSGKTLALTAATTAPAASARHVFTSSDDGQTWTDVTHDVVSTSFNRVTWGGKDFYIATSGEGILRRKALDP